MKRTKVWLLGLSVSCLAAAAFAAPSLQINKPPVVGINSGPAQDPHSVKGQWFTNLVSGAVDYRPYEFYDNVSGAGGGPGGSGAIHGRIINLVYAGPPGVSPIVGLSLSATILNDAVPGLQGWPPGSNRHNESLLTESTYSGPLYNVKLAVEFAIADEGHVPQQFIGPYTNANNYYFVAENEDQWAWYCWNPSQESVGDYYVPTWDFGTIPLSHNTNRTLVFRIPGAGIPQGDPLYGQLSLWYSQGTDILANRSTSLKISTWIDALSADLGVPVFEPPFRGSDCSVFHDVLDFGDAPDRPYPTLLASDGARHWVDPLVRLGAYVDGEADGQPTALADGDDNNGFDDEDGVTFTPPLVGGQSASVTVVASVAGFLNAWLDGNADGDWADAGEQIFVNQPLAAGANVLGFTVPPVPVATNSYARFRFNKAGGLSPTGLAADGEVEDYRVQLQASEGTPPGGEAKWSQPPDCDQGLDVEAWRTLEGQPGMPYSLVADDWLCDGRPITGLRWWGSYIGWQTNNPTPLMPPPSQRPVGFRVTWYQDIPAAAGEFSRPGAIIAATNFPLASWESGPLTGAVTETWYCLSQLDFVQPGMVEHEYEYELVFPTNLAWNEKQGTVYWLSVQALYSIQSPQPTNFWGWKTTHPSHNWNDDAIMANYRIMGGQTNELVYPPPGWEQVGSRHPYYGQSVNMAFELLTDVVGRRARKWAQPPDMKTGENMPSYRKLSEAAGGTKRADDFVSDGRRITDLHWWGSYLSYETLYPGPIEPPPAGDQPLGFWLSWHSDVPAGAGADPFSKPLEPAITNVFVPFQYCHEVFYGTVTQYWHMPHLYEHEFQYYVDFLNPEIANLGPWLEQSGTVYWVDIQAAFPDAWQPGRVHNGWGWKTTPPENRWNDASVLRDAVALWQPATYPQGHIYEGTNCDLAFELTTDEVGTGTNWWNQPIVFTAIVASNVVLSVGDAGSGVQVLQWCTNLASNVWVNLATNPLPLPGPNYTNVWYDIPPGKPLKFYRVKQTATP